MASVQEFAQAPSALQPSEHTFRSRDGTELFYRAWLPDRPTTKALLLFHRGHEHSGRWQETVATLGLEDVAVFAWDQRGHGRSPGERASSPVKRFEVLKGFSHALFHEKDRRLVVEKVRDFIRECFAQPPSSPSLLDADRHGFTRDEYDRLCRPGGLHFAPVRWLMKGPGRLSRGIDLGWKHGYDSGFMLDYIYENRSQGITPLGRFIDRIYLNAIGWRGIRVRRRLLEEALRSIIEQTHAAGQAVRLLDIASGPGRYVLETIRKLDTIPISAVLRDYKQENLDAAARLRDQLGLANVTITHGDAFDRASLAAVTPRPTIAIVSGLYELFPDNEPVLHSLRGLADAVEPGGHLVYTNQPWHPQVEFIARVLTNREGRPWIMRRRTQAEMDELVRAAGFEKVSGEIDPWGIFTVSVARRAGG
jgi:SAM-dependent methyltransferase